MAIDDYFSSGFRALTRDGPKEGYAPLSWQRRLFERFCQNDIPKTCDLPTGLGKTSVIHIWLLALRRQILEQKRPRLPTRLVYVVDRRTVVDQATTLAEGIKNNLPSLNVEDDWVSVSTLRGRFADNREWTIDPSRPAIVIGTVDMIGSRLLFSGYRSSYKCRPLDAGLLGQDSLLILDEAHLSEPFETLIRALSDEGKFQGGQGLPMRVMCMSATASGNDANPFTLERGDLVAGDPETDPIIQRYEAKKQLRVDTVEQKAVQAEIINAARSLGEDNSRGVVFVRRPEDAIEIAQAIRKHKPFLDAVEVLTGTMRGLERDELLEKPVLRRFLDGDEKPEDRSGKGPAILVSTSAGEVGFDLNADHMVCDAAPLDSLIQRLGRVNRRGYGDATVRVFVAKTDGKRKEEKPEKKKRTLESATAEAIKCLDGLPGMSGDGTRDASPKAIDELKKKLTPRQLQQASTPKPATVELTDILLDAWSMTTITCPMPGRPPVAPWLRGMDAEEPQTTIAWRAELDIEEFDRLDLDDIEEWFDAYRILPHETLSVPASKAAKWLVERWDLLAGGSSKAIFARSCVIERAGLELVGLDRLAEELRERTDSIVHASIILPASFGGIQTGRGLLDKTAPKPAEGGSDGTTPDSLRPVDVADEREPRLRRILDGDAEKPLVGEALGDIGGMARFAFDLPCDGDTSKQLVCFIPRRERLDFGTRRQRLWRHVGLVRKQARDVVQRLAVSAEICQAVNLAAAWHDHGKDREMWQRAVGRGPEERPIGKSGGSMKRVSRGYRHEFGSLREFIDAHEGKISNEVFDLAAHLIAAHHGRGRPHFPKGGFDPSAAARSPEIAVDVIRRFARLQRRYGYWQLAWLENLLRCADATASAENGKK